MGSGRGGGRILFARLSRGRSESIREMDWRRLMAVIYRGHILRADRETLSALPA